jgi:secondary thiamine-phosphate synthase enzyme
MAGHPTRPSPAAGLSQASGRIALTTDGKGLIDITRPVAHWLVETGVDEGLLTVFIRHTSASLTIQENADPDVLADLVDALERLAPEHGRYRHGAEGPDDMPAHIKASLTATSLSIPVADGAMVLGTWQGLYLWEHRSRRHERELALHFMGTLR